jgi:cyclophilin family peptidyl-prolyl cis-trans isomerase
MFRYFIEFINIDSNDSITVTFKLFSNSLPKTTSKIAKIFYTENNKDISYKKSKVTRIIAPEFLVQFGQPVRRSMKSIKNLIDLQEFENVGEKFYSKLNGRCGLLCIAEKPDLLKTEYSIELFILFVPWGKYHELNGYVVIGECKEWVNLKNWMSNVKVKQNEIGSWEIPIKDCVWINRCGRIQVKELDKNENEKNENNENKRKSNKIKAIDLLFKTKKARKI